MQIFESPYAIITIFVLGFIVLAAIGIYFAMRGVKTAEGQEENNFTTINKIENSFKKSAKSRSDKCIMYVSVSSDNLHGMRAEKSIFLDIKQVLLNTFSTAESDIAIYDGKDFVIFANCDSQSAQDKAQKCQEDLNKCFFEHGVLNLVNVRVGACFVQGAHVTFDNAILRAKQACMLAKNKNVFYVEWDASSGKELEKKIKIENNIEKEIDNNNFFLEYQPVVEAKTKKIIGAEVLSRLNSESDGILTPRSFLSAVDSVGINKKFDYYIFEKNCKWISNNKTQRENYKFTINFSRATLSDPGFVEKIINIAEKYSLNLSCLAVEILEDKNVLGEAKQQMINNLSELKQKGVSILLDDFGSGYTTFGDLQNLDISIVKIDKSITHNSTDETGFIILKNIIQTAKDIGFKTLCEGIETKEQEEAAIRAGCDLLQGFYYYRPMSVSTLENLFRDN